MEMNFRKKGTKWILTVHRDWGDAILAQTARDGTVYVDVFVAWNGKGRELQTEGELS